MFPDITTGAWSAFLAGLIISPHCVGMCGPLYCSLMPLKGGVKESNQTAYHIGRVISYVSIGTLAGSLSLGFAQFFEWSISRFFPWLIVVVLFAFAVGVDKWFLKIKTPTPRFVTKMVAKSRRFPPEISSLCLGLFSPLLPCAPLYMVFWVALLSGDPFFGAQIMLGFSLGTIPLLWISQSQFLRNREKWSSKTIQIVQRSVSLVAALILAIRLVWVGTPLDGGACITG